SLLRSDLVDVPAAAQTGVYVTIVVLWVAAFGYSLREYLRDRENESSDAVSRLRAEQETQKPDTGTADEPAGAPTVG
ncbi:MAG: sulfite exporter TauE/SafE family protein, partial [Actinomycetota bacterium]|nr:sulfite exporter TauE/SafE family protein [Actinomycetota bacterium]